MSEILAPLGEIEGLPLILNAGATAVYTGLKNFSARKNAINLSFEQLETACAECHKRGVKLYVTLNTLVYDSELDELSRAIKRLAKAGVDGVIVQDLGVGALVAEICPKLHRHASTQMTLNSAVAVNAAKTLGYTRAVIGRELSFKEISYIAKNTDIELEVFVHGALCACVSGQCHMSALFGGRSGNRGLCAQPCRLGFTSRDKRKNVLSLKDNSLIDHLTELESIGICSFKIEGRMKRPEYAAAAADACAKALRREEYDRERLKGIFSRDGLTDGYFTGDLRDMTGTRGKSDVESSAKALEGIKSLYRSELPRFRADIFAVVVKDKPISAKAVCGGLQTECFGDTPEAAKGQPVTESSVCDRLKKLGGTQFYAGKVSAKVDEGLYVSAAALNQLRRELCDSLSDEILRENTPRYDIFEPKRREKAHRQPASTAYRCEVSDKRLLDEALRLPFELVYAPDTLLDENTPNKDRIAVIPPFFLAGREDAAKERLLRLKSAGFSRGMAQTLGHAALLKECGFRVHGGYRMNVLNSLSAEVCEKLGFLDITLSFEGSLTALADVSCAIPRGIVAYGRLPLMLMRRCPIANGMPCPQDCPKAIFDRYGKEIPVRCMDGGSSELLNPDTLLLCDKQELIKRFDFAMFRFTGGENPKRVLDMYINEALPQGRFTRGLYMKGVL